MMFLDRVRKFLAKPIDEKIFSLRYRFKCVWDFIFPFIPLPVKLPFGCWWIAVNDFNSDSIFAGDFEIGETRFVSGFLKEGMVVLDIGAHHGFYTLLASRKVGEKGKVIAFEPSERERNRLLSHIKLNNCKNVLVEPFALSSKVGSENLYVVMGKDTGCNSLRRPNVSEDIKVVEVKTITLENYLLEKGINKIDLIKIDVEGAELEILKGAGEILKDKIRPLVLCEISDSRTEPWGYKSDEVIRFVETCNYKWFGLNKKGEIVEKDKSETYNLLAIPGERVGDFTSLK